MNDKYWVLTIYRTGQTADFTETMTWKGSLFSFVLQFMEDRSIIHSFEISAAQYNDLHKLI